MHGNCKGCSLSRSDRKFSSRKHATFVLIVLFSILGLDRRLTDNRSSNKACKSRRVMYARSVDDVSIGQAIAFLGLYLE